MSMTHDLVLFFDVDNTLLDNDRVYAGLHARIEGAVGKQLAERFWEIYNEVRVVRDVVNFPQALERFRTEFPEVPGAARLHELVFSFPFAECVFESSPAAVAHARNMGLVAILSDGDPVFQPHKITASGLRDLFEGRVLLREHKELEFDSVERVYPAQHYVMVDDKPRIHRALKERYGSAITTIMVTQGHYAASDRDYGAADIVLEDIGELTKLSPDDVRARVPADD